MFVFPKIWCVLFSWNTLFEIRPFGLLRTIYHNDGYDDPELREIFSEFDQSSKIFNINNVWKIIATIWKMF